MKFFYAIFAFAIIFDIAISPWLFGVGWLPKLVLVFLPFPFIFLSFWEVFAIFSATLIYLRSTTSFNAGIIFLSLALFLFYERRLIAVFFQKTALPTIIFSGGGIIVFYIAILGASAIFGLKPAIDWGVAASCGLGTVFGALANALLLKIYPAKNEG